MDFFAAEDRATRSTVLLVFLYIISIAAVIFGTDAAIAAGLAVYASGRSTSTGFSGLDQSSFSSVFDLLLPYIGIAVSLIVIIATLIKANELRGGGTIFACMLGARFLADTPTDPAEVRLKHVVEEMALAAGVKSPQICILENEPGINAFAAGTNNHDPVIGITAGCLTHLTRDELQGIVGHEFSHILHNDTVLNTRAYAMLFGLLAISLIGGKLVSVSLNVGERSSRSGGGMGIFLIVGLVMMIVGWIGGLAGRLVRAAMVRQREYLADASAVQYTRNADGVASALYKMATCGSQLRHSSGEETEHFLFGAGTASAWGKFGLTRTHPLTASRINAIRPGFQPSGSGAVPVAKLDEKESSADFNIEMSLGSDANAPSAEGGIWSGGGSPLPELHGPSLSRPGTVGGIPLGNIPPLGSDFGPLLPLGAIATGGPVSTTAAAPASGETAGEAPVPTFASPPGSANDPAPTGATAEETRAAGVHVSSVPSGPVFAPPKPPGSVLAKIPGELLNASAKPNTAATVCFILAVADYPNDKWATLLASYANLNTAGLVDQALPEIKALTLQPRMALLDTCVASLQALSPCDQTALIKAVSASLQLADQPDIVALAVFWRLTRYLGSSAAIGAKVATWAEGATSVAVLLATVARQQCGPGVLAPKAYEAAQSALASLGPLPLMPAQARPSDVHAALCVLAAASLATRDAVVKAAAKIVADEDIPESHADLVLRLICDAADQDIPRFCDRWV